MGNTAKTSIYSWLIQQKDRDDPIGDFAKKAITDEGFPKTTDSIDVLHRYLAYNKNADSEVLKLLVKVAREFNKSTQNNKRHGQN